MPEFTVYFTQTMSTAITVEAEDADSAIEAAEESSSLPGTGLCVHCSGGGLTGHAGVDTAGQWEPSMVDDADGKTVWEERPV